MKLLISNDIAFLCNKCVINDGYLSATPVDSISKEKLNEIHENTGIQAILQIKYKYTFKAEDIKIIINVNKNMETADGDKVPNTQREQATHKTGS